MVCTNVIIFVGAYCARRILWKRYSLYHVCVCVWGEGSILGTSNVMKQEHSIFREKHFQNLKAISAATCGNSNACSYYVANTFHIKKNRLLQDKTDKNLKRTLAK